MTGYRDFTCVIPLTKEYDMLRDDSLYNYFNNYISFVYATVSEDNANKQIYQLAFSCLPLLGASNNKNVDVHENIFLKYFKKATFMMEINEITNIYHFYRNEGYFGRHFETINYMILHYDGKTDLQESFGHRCFSEYFDDSRNEVVAPKCFTNEFVMLYGSNPEAHLQFYFHVDSNVSNSFVSRCIKEDYGNDNLFVAEYDCFEVTLFNRRFIVSGRTELFEFSIMFIQGHYEI